jgi:hypothetical protein
MARIKLTKASTGISKEIDVINFDIEFLEKDIRQAGNKQDRTKLAIHAKDYVKKKRRCRNLEKQLRLLDGLKDQIDKTKMTSTVNECVDSITGYLDSIPVAEDQLDRQQKMQNFMKEMERMNMSNELMSDMLNESEDDDELEEENAAVTKIIEAALIDGSIAQIEKLPQIIQKKPKIIGSNNNNNNNNVNRNTEIDKIDEFIKKL